ncbi:MAG: DUF4870 domain-containing protein [Candidatus Nanoarchaeia archaeon]|nr:DUF4870 domain-containing protein [Candidatus Nanoarchaeia archaeon]
MENENVNSQNINNDDNIVNMAIHLLGLFTGFIAPLIFLLISKKEEVKKHAKIVLNWQLTLMIYYLISLVTLIIIIGALGFAVFGTLNIIFSIVGMLKANDRILWEYPLSIRFLK